ncbi:MAG: hypothetical protein ACKOEC_02630 [Acidimicrobiia bacterium]
MDINGFTRRRIYLRTNQFHFEHYAFLIKRLKEIDEGRASILDNSILLGGSNLPNGDAHSADQISLVLTGKGDDNRRACSLYLSIMDRMGLQLERFGDTDKRLAEL